MDKSEVIGKPVTEKNSDDTTKEAKAFKNVEESKETPTVSEGSDDGEEIDDIPDDEDDEGRDDDKSLSKKGDEDKKNAPVVPRKAGKKRNRRTLTKEDLRSKFHLTLREAAQELDICITTVKKACRQHGIKRWPRRKLKAIERVSDIRKEQEQSNTSRPTAEGVALSANPVMLPQMGGMMMNMGYPQMMMYGGNPTMMIGANGAQPAAMPAAMPAVVPQMAAHGNIFPQTSSGMPVAQQQAMYGSFFGFPNMGNQQMMVPQQGMQPRVAVPPAFYGALAHPNVSRN